MRPDPDRARRLLATKGWLADQPEDLRRQILSGAHIMERQPGEYVYAMGDAPTGIYALTSGRLKFVNYLSSGREVGTWITEPVDWFGEVSMFDRLPRLQSTIALDRCVVLHLPAAGFEAIVAACPAYWRNFGLILSGHLRTAMRFLEDVAAEASHIRVGRLLVMMAAGESEREVTAGVVVEVSQDQLASTTGLSRQSANKALKRLEGEGLVERRYGAVILTDPARLAALGR
ncbi:Crp/Fnr family transcriptional regulator [Zavarzinia aquatilis]|uniref:Crp/Fnr family transcriptional regulator n=1 Tax=Zavarzinia aquatilis TaxID=2211142 RepID=A0A317E8L3_9PROT|nr:Crp/Fnr family transcriptional regulator [Zavarzinia aquatilis]PWR22892.1 hypothetical protein DKG74_10760 [Zavarzinia aquatilis]